MTSTPKIERIPSLRRDVVRSRDLELPRYRVTVDSRLVGIYRSLATAQRAAAGIRNGR